MFGQTITVNFLVLIIIILTATLIVCMREHMQLIQTMHKVTMTVAN
jgi:hypothetical protein